MLIPKAKIVLLTLRKKQQLESGFATIKAASKRSIFDSAGSQGTNDLVGFGYSFDWGLEVLFTAARSWPGGGRGGGGRRICNDVAFRLQFIESVPSCIKGDDGTSVAVSTAVTFLLSGGDGSDSNFGWRP